MVRRYYLILIVLISTGLTGVIAFQFYWLVEVYRAEVREFDRGINRVLYQVSNKLDQLEKDLLINNTVTVNLDKEQASPRQKQTFNISRVSTSLMKKLNAAGGKRQLIISDSLPAGTSAHPLPFKLVEKKIEKLLNEKLVGTRRQLIQNQLDSLLQQEMAQQGLQVDYAVVALAGHDTLLKGGPLDKMAFGSEKEMADMTVYHMELFPSEHHKSPWKANLYTPANAGFSLSRLSGLFGLSLFYTVLLIVIFTLSLRMLIKNKKLAEVRSQMINNLTHELKTPISTIYIAANQISQLNPITENDQIITYSEIIKSEDKRILKHVESVLDLSKSEHKNFELNKELAMISDVVKTAINQSTTLIREKHGKLFLHEDPNLKPIYMDPQKVLMAIRNIIDNAIKYSKPTAEVYVSITQTTALTSIAVSDKGIGIKSSELDKIFENFYRVPDNNRHDVSGYGIGLSFAKNVIEKHNGTIAVASKPGIGSTFTIHIPYH